jgi:hypothetical protein
LTFLAAGFNEAFFAAGFDEAFFAAGLDEVFFATGFDEAFFVAGFDEAFFAALGLVAGFDEPSFAEVDLVVARRSRTRSEEPPWGIGSAVTSAMSTVRRETREKSDQRMVDVDRGMEGM